MKLDGRSPVVRKSRTKENRKMTWALHNLSRNLTKWRRRWPMSDGSSNDKRNVSKHGRRMSKASTIRFATVTRRSRTLVMKDSIVYWISKRGCTQNARSERIWSSFSWSWPMRYITAISLSLACEPTLTKLRAKSARSPPIRRKRRLNLLQNEHAFYFVIIQTLETAYREQICEGVRHVPWARSN